MHTHKPRYTLHTIDNHNNASMVKGWTCNIVPKKRKGDSANADPSQENDAPRGDFSRFNWEYYNFGATYDLIS